MRRIMRASAIVTIWGMILAFHSSAYAEEKAVWDKTPIPVVLDVEKERMISFPFKSVRAKIPVEIVDKIYVLSNNGTLYLKAKEPFTEQQVLVQDKKTKKIIILSLSADAEKGSSEALTVLLDDKFNPESSSAKPSQQASQEEDRLGYEDLIRIAAKHLYAPARLIDLPSSVRRVNIRRAEDTRLVRGRIIAMRPVIGFKHQGLYVTAVKLINQSARAVTLDPRDLRGAWLAASFQHVHLGPKGQDTDTTALYLISKRPFWEAY